LSALKIELSGNYNRVIISDENLFNTSIQKRLRSLLEQYATSWRVLCYVRRPDEHIVSDYQQAVKGPHILTFDQFFEKRLADSYYRYDRLLDRWAAVFGREAVEVRVFHRKTLQGSPIEDFTQWVGWDTKALSADAKAPANESLDRVNTELIRLLHLGLVERPDLMQRHSLAQITGRLRRFDTGERVWLDTARAKRLQEKVRVDHEQLAERYLSPEHAAVLLAPPPEGLTYPPLDRDELARRIMRLFHDPELVRFAQERAEQPSHLDTIPRELIARPREEVAARTLRNFARSDVWQKGSTALRRMGRLVSSLAAAVRRR
jgi:hypothetical protein